jgi:XTP/dITP diphosphohydrolase
MNRTLVIGTGNRHKVSEIAPLLAGLDLTLKAAGDYGPFHPEENGATAEANAIIKARAAMELSCEWAIADDTALEIDALGGQPGIYAARYAGPECDFNRNIEKVLCELDGVPNARRAARFVCVIALCRPGHEPQLFRGECPGRIATARRGASGFGYDPIFVIDALKKTFAELSAEEKNRISHRALATFQLRSALERLLAANRLPE